MPANVYVYVLYRLCKQFQVIWTLFSFSPPPIMTTGQKGKLILLSLFPPLPFTVFIEKSLPNNQTFHAARPPQINWASRPIARTDIPTGSEALVSTDSLQPPETAINPTGRRLVAVYVDADRLTQLEGVLSQLGLPFLLTPGPDHRHLDHFKCAPQKKEEPHVSDQLVELEQMTASLSTLSTSEDFDMKPSNLFSPRSLIPNTPHTSFLVSPGKKRYYSITVGKCTGVYWDTW